MKAIVQKPLMIKIIKIRLKNSDNEMVIWFINVGMFLLSLLIRNWLKNLFDLKSTRCTTTNLPSRKPPKLDEADMWDTAGEVRTNS